MDTKKFKRATMIWFLIVVAAIANGSLREFVLTPSMGRSVALPLSGITLAGMILFVTWVSSGFLLLTGRRIAVEIGLFWLGLTLIFEFVFGYFVTRKPLEEILSVFDITRGNLFILVLLVTVTAPWIVARLRGMI